MPGCLFDIDGTMTDSDPVHFKAFEQHLQTWGYKARPQLPCGVHSRC